MPDGTTINITLIAFSFMCVCFGAAAVISVVKDRE